MALGGGAIGSVRVRDALKRCRVIWLETVWEGVDDVFLAAVGAELSAFAALASGDTTATNVPGAADSVRAVAIGEAARESAASGAPVPVS